MKNESFDDDGLFTVSESSGTTEQFIDNNEFVFPPDKTNKSIKDDNSYILLLNEEVMLTGNHKTIEDKIKFLVYQKNVDIMNLTVLKKMNIKVGIFLEQ
jgi:hypothetical protein